jgi:hypothetical protein
VRATTTRDRLSCSGENPTPLKGQVLSVMVRRLRHHREANPWQCDEDDCHTNNTDDVTGDAVIEVLDELTHIQGSPICNLDACPSKDLRTYQRSIGSRLAQAVQGSRRLLYLRA